MEFSRIDKKKKMAVNFHYTLPQDLDRVDLAQSVSIDDFVEIE